MKNKQSRVFVLSTGLLIILMIIIALSGINGTLNISKLHSLMYDHPLTVGYAVRDIRIEIVSMHRSMKDVALSKNPEQFTKTINLVNRHEVKAYKHFDIVFDRFLGDINDVDNAYSAFVDWKPIREEIFKLSRTGDIDAAYAITIGKGADHVAYMNKMISTLEEFANAKGNEFYTGAQTTVNETIRNVVFISIFIIIISILMSIFIINIISKYIKEQKLAEKLMRDAKDLAESTTKSKSDFLANMSHEIRTPMNAIIGLDTLLARTIMSDKQRDYVDKIGNSANNLLGIINDILDFSKIEAGKLEIENTNFNLNDVLENLSGMISEKARVKDLELVFDQDINISENLIGDPLRIGQILLNLVNNAIKFTDTGEIIVKYKVIDHNETNQVIRFDVKDTGIGLTEQQVGKLFKSFSQADTSTTRKYGGTGLGLSISKKLAELMGGEIGVESLYGEGSSFYFTVDLGLGKNTQDIKKVTPEDLIGMNVLVVDDNESARDVLTAYLEDFSFNVKSVESGEIAIRELNQRKADDNKNYDLILMDYQMNGLNGIETSKIIRNEIENIDTPKIIMVSAFGREDIISGSKSTGIQGFLIKPVSPSILYDSIMDAFGKESNKIRQIKKTDDTKPDGFNKILGAKLLLVEDNEINQQVAKETLEHEGFYVEIAADGKIATEVLKKNHDYDLVLMDLQMPVMGGYEATKVIREELKISDLPIIAMTADAMTGVREKVVKVGMNDYVTKPIDAKDLWRALTQWIKPMERELPVGFVSPEDSNQNINVPQINGIDTQTALSRVGNNLELYTSLLKRFFDEYKDLTTRVKNSLGLKNDTDAKRDVHSAKGVSSNLGIEKYEEHMKLLEKFIESGDDIEDLLSNIDDTYNILLVEVENSGILKNIESMVKEAKDLNTTNILSELELAKTSLIKRKPKPALELFSNLKSYDLTGDIISIIDETKSLLDKYKMKEAVLLLDKLIDIFSSMDSTQ